MFDPLYQPYAGNRYCVTAANGMVATGSNLAAAAGLEVMRNGGNAIDAAVATAAALTVVEPTANGLGSDSFALVWVKDHLYGLNSSGYSPKHISLEEVKKNNPEGMPKYGWTPVMVPGAVKAWPTLVQRFGKLTLAQDLAPAIRYAEEGYPLGPMLSRMWERSTRIFHERFDGNPVFNEWFRTFTKDGESYHFGEIVRLPNHARTLRLIAETDSDAFYKGEIADQLDAQSRRDGGYIRKEDLVDYSSQWVEPIRVNYRGYEVCEIPPNGQGIAALMALNILNNFSLQAKESTDTVHKQIEAMKLAFADTMHYVTDPKDMTVDYSCFLKPEYGAMRAKEINAKANLPSFVQPPKSGTVYLCTADGEGNMVSFIQSNFKGFGSGIVIPGWGLALNDRGHNFSLDPARDNCLAPGKKPYHTIIPGFVTKDGEAVGPFGVMGGFMQPQGHLQVLVNTLDYHMNPQAALDAPRWQWIEGKKIEIEAGVAPEIIEGLRQRGHEVIVKQDTVSFGRGQIIWRQPDGILCGATEPRTDGTVAAF